MGETEGGGSTSAGAPTSRETIAHHPDFVVVGAPKCGTTSLYRHLSRLPDFWLSQRKELNFFIAERNWPKGLDWYAAQFEAAPPGRVRGEISPQYSRGDVFGGVPARMAATIPDARLIYLVREPIARMRSEYVHRVAQGREDRALEEVALDPSRPYLSTSNYATQLDRFLDHYPRDRVLVMPAERLFSDPVDVVGRLAAFVGVPADVAADHDFAHENAGSGWRARPGLARRLARLPGWHWVAQRVPAGIRDRYVRATSAPIDRSRAELSDGLRAELEDRFAPQIERIRAHVDADLRVDWLS